MNIKRILFLKQNLALLFTLFLTSALFAWGPTGHRTTAEIAQKYLSNKTKRKLKPLLNNHDLAYWANYADAIRSDKKYKAYAPWHYVNFKYGEDYMLTEKNPKGDVIQAIKTCIAVLKDENATIEDQSFHLKLLIHFIGDLHQPLHTGHGEDLGGNSLKVEWFWKPSNLHRVWDEGMLDQYGMSYTELADSYAPLTKKEQKKIKKGTIIDWMKESQGLSEKVVYPSINTSTDINYVYMYDYFPVVEKQLQKGGVRLAKILNEIYN